MPIDSESISQNLRWVLNRMPEKNYERIRTTVFDLSRNTVFDLSQHFHCYVLTLKGSEDRLALFEERAEELGVTGYNKIYGVDGDKIEKPNWWKPISRAFACNLAHVNALHAGIMADGDKPILIFEDDAYLRDHFVDAIKEVVAAFRDSPKLKVCYLGGRVTRKGRFLGKYLRRRAKVTGGYGYIISAEHAPTVAGYMLNLPGDSHKHYAFYNDVMMRRRRVGEGHTVVDPVCVGHRGGRSVLRKNVHRRGRDCTG